MKENYMLPLKSKSILFLVTFFLCLSSFAQTYYNIATRNGSTITTCSGIFTDSGGTSGNYSNGENNSVTFTSGNGGNLVFNFNEFELEN